MTTTREILDTLPTDIQWNLGVTWDDHLVIPTTMHNALTSACSVNEANARYLNEHWADYVTTHGGGYGLLVALPLDEEAPEDLAEVLTRLEDYPLICEETHTEVEMEWEQEAWEMFGVDEVRRELTYDENEAVTAEQITATIPTYIEHYGPWHLEGDDLIFDRALFAQAVVDTLIPA